MPITPDTKDWTFVLGEVCAECGFDVRSFPREDIAGMIRDNAASWPELLEHPKVAERPDDSTWAGIEYACHVRDVYKLYDERLQMMIEQDDPHYPNWDQDETALADRYLEQDPKRVAEDLRANATSLAARFDTVEGDRWERTGVRSDGAHFTIESFARYLIHDPVHHVNDVKNGYEALG